MLKKLWNGTPKEKGQTLVLVAVMMMALLGLTAVAIDLSYVFVQRRDMQNAADAGALAGGRMLAHFSANPTLSYRYRDVYYEVLRAAQANGAQDISAFLVHCGDRTPYYELRPNDYGAVQRCPCACGVWVKTEIDFGTFFAQIFSVRELSAAAEAQCEFGLPRYATGLSPIALRDTVLKQGAWGGVGGTYTLWDSGKEGGANRGWLGLDCKYPAKGSNCSPDANSLKAWMDEPHYTGQVDLGNMVGGDPGTKTSVLHHADIGETLVIPIFNYLYHFTNYRYCDPKDPKYNWSKCKAHETTEGSIPVYTRDSGYNGKYYYNITGFAAFEVTAKGQSGGDKYLTGKLTSKVINADWKGGPEHLEYANGNYDSFGTAVVKLTK